MRHIMAASLALLLAVPVRAATPADVVSALYKGHFAHQQRFDETMRRQRALFAAPLLALLDADAARSARTPDEVVGLDFDPIVNAQEEASGYEIGATTTDGADKLVAVTVRFGKEKHSLRVRLAPAGETWRIANIHYAESDLVSILKTLAKEARK